MTGANPMMPSDASLLQVLSGLEDEGYDAQFLVVPEGEIRCVRGGHRFAATAAQLDESRRLEGVSDPADMLMIYALHCPICGAAGTLVLHFGPEASAEEADVLSALEPPRGARSGSAGASPA